jgi:hypothetical protein
MKRTAWKKDYIVILKSDYDNTWAIRTKNLTYGQAVKYVLATHLDNAMLKGTAKIVTLNEFAEMMVTA